jgi:hypothetical protein
MGFLIDRALVSKQLRIEDSPFHRRSSIFRLRKEVRMMKARYEKPRLVIQTIVLATLAGQYDEEQPPLPTPME